MAGVELPEGRKKEATLGRTEHPAAAERGRIALAIGSAALACFVMQMAMVMAPIALPRTVADLNGMALYSWAITAPALTGAVATIIMGKLSDLYGRRAIFTATLVLLIVGSAAAAVSQDMGQFVLARGVQGLGFGALIVLALSVVGDLFPPAERGKWAAVVTAGQLGGGLVAPTLGGMLTDVLGWRFAFWALLPLALLNVILVWSGVPADAQRGKARIDYQGLALLVVASTATLVALSWAGKDHPWGSLEIVGMLGGSAVVWAIFGAVESRAEDPILAPTLLRNRVFLTISFFGLLSMGGLTAALVYLPLFLQGVQGLSATVSGQMLTSFALAQPLAGIGAGLLLTRLKRYRCLIVVSYAIASISMFWMWRFDGATPALVVVLAAILAGVGLGTLPNACALAVQNAAPRQMLGQATGGMFFIVMIGSALAPAMMGSAMNSAYSEELQANLPVATTRVLNASTLASLDNPRVLLSAPAMDELKQTFAGVGSEAAVLFEETVHAVRNSLAGALAELFLLSALAMVVAALGVLTVPDIPLAEGEERPAQQEAVRPLHR